MRPTLPLFLALAGACGGGGESSAGGSTSTTAQTTATTTGGSTDAGTTAGSTSSAATTTATPTTSGTTGGDIKYDLGAMPDLGNDTGPVDESTCEAAAMSLTSAGCVFAPTVGNTDTNLPWAVVAANTSSAADASVALYAADGQMLEAAVVAPGQLHTFILQAQSAPLLQHATPSQTAIAGKAMRLESDVPVVAYQFSPYSSSQVATADASLLLPTHAWGQDYLVPSYHNSDFSDSWVSIVSLTDANEVTVEMPAAMQGSTSPGGTVPGLGAGQSTTQTIDASEVLRIVSPGDGVADLTGMRVKSTGPVAVMTGAPSMSLPGPGMNFYKDYLEEQIPPRTAWGKDYAVVKFRPRSDEGDLYRLIADKDGTTLTITGGYQGMVTLNEGEFHEFITPASFRVEGSEAFMVAHYMLSQDQSSGPKDDTEYPGPFISKNCEFADPEHTELGDPAITFIPPTAQYRFNSAVIHSKARAVRSSPRSTRIDGRLRYRPFPPEYSGKHRKPPPWWHRHRFVPTSVRMPALVGGCLPPCRGC